MSAVVGRGKRSLPITISDDSDDDVQILEVKKPRISKNEAKDSRVPAKMCNVLNFLENSPRLKRFVKTVLSALGISCDNENIESVEDSEEEWDNVPEEEENHFPVPHYSAQNLTEKVKHSTATHFQNTYKEIGKRKNTFVTLGQTHNTRAKLPDSIYAQHEECNFESKHVSAMPFKCSLDNQNEALKQVTKSVNGKKHNSIACGDSTNVFSDGRGDILEIKTPFLHDIDDIQLLFDENKPSHIHSSTLNGQQHLNGSVISTTVEQSNGLKNISESRDSKIVQRVQGTRSAYFRRRLYDKLPRTLRSRQYFSYRQNKASKMSFTTDEVVRIQEKEQYQELLQRYCSEHWTRQTKSKFTKNVSIQVDMEKLSITDNHFPNTCLNFPQSVAQNGLSTGDSKDLSLISECEVSQDEAKSKSFDSKSYSRPFRKQQTSLSLLKPSPSVLPSFSDHIEVDDILSFKTKVNGNNFSHDQHQPSSSHFSEYDKLPEIKSSDLNGSQDVIFESMKSQAKASQFNTDCSLYNHRKRESQHTSRKLSKGHSVLEDFPEIISENAKSSLIPSKKKDLICDSNTSQPFLFPSIKNDLPNKSSDFSAKIEYRHLRDIRLKPKPKSSVFASTSWIQELKQKMEEEARERQKFVADQELQLIEYKKIQADKYAEFKKLLYREEIETPDIICIEKEPSLPRLTPEMNEIIDETLAPHGPNEVISTISNITVLWKDIDTLSGSNWLNDEIINSYMSLIQERSKEPNYPSVYAFTSFFYPKLKSHGFAAVKRWTRKVDIFRFDLLLIPLHLGVHWCLAVVDHRYKKIQYYDSMDANENCLTLLRDYLIAEFSDKKRQVFDSSGWVLEKMKNIPPQLNGSDCGMFTLKYAEYIARNVEINFTQQNMQYFRRKMVYEIITGFLS